MKRLLVFAAAILIPALSFAQIPQDRGTKLLRDLGLSDAQIAQVQDVENKARTAIKDDLVHLRLLKAQINEAMLPSNAKPDLAAINKLVDQKAQLRGDMEKTFLAAKVQLMGIMGKDSFDKYARVVRREFGMGGFRGGHGMGGFKGPMMGAPGAAKP